VRYSFAWKNERFVRGKPVRWKDRKCVKMRTRLHEVDVIGFQKIYRRLDYNALQFLRSAGNAFANLIFVEDEPPVFPRARNCHKVTIPKVEIPFFTTLVINP